MAYPKWLERRCMKHRIYVSKRMAELQNEICKEAISTGVVNKEKRAKLFKYKDHLRWLGEK